VLKSSTVRIIIMALLLLSCTATNAYASMFELEIVPISKINKDPTVYDSTMAYRKISVVGNISELSKKYVNLTENSTSLKVDTTEIKLFDGFNVGDQAMITGQFRYDPLEDSIFIPTYVLHYPTVDMGLVNISSIVSNSSAHNGRYMTVIGNMSKIDMSTGIYQMTIRDDNNNDLKVYYYGSTKLVPGDVIKVFGLYNGRILYSESMGLNKSPLSISTLVPGFTSIMGSLAILSIALLLKSKRRND
jgi:hypothetical protein